MDGDLWRDDREEMKDDDDRRRVWNQATKYVPKEDTLSGRDLACKTDDDDAASHRETWQYLLLPPALTSMRHLLEVQDKNTVSGAEVARLHQEYSAHSSLAITTSPLAQASIYWAFIHHVHHTCKAHDSYLPTPNLPSVKLSMASPFLTSHIMYGEKERKDHGHAHLIVFKTMQRSESFRMILFIRL